MAELFFPGVNDYFLNYYLVCLIFCITIYLIFILKIVIWFTIWLNTSSLLEFFFSPLVISILHFSVMLQWDGLFPRLTSQLWLRRLHSQLKISLCPLLYCIPFVLNLVFVLISLILHSVGEQTSNFLRQLMKVQISISFMSENDFTLPSYLRVWMEGMFPHNEKDIAPLSSSFIITAEKSSFLIIQI